MEHGIKISNAKKKKYQNVGEAINFLNINLWHMFYCFKKKKN